MNGREIADVFVDFIQSVPVAFPVNQSKSWTPTLTAFFLAMADKKQYEVRCGDYYKKIAAICQERQITTLPGKLVGLEQPWKTHGLLDIDLCWVPIGFNIPKDFSDVPVPRSAEIELAFEYENEGTIYTDRQGTNLNVILDEVRKFGNVRSNIKVLSYVSSISEIDSENHIDLIQKEIRLIPDRDILTQEWVVVALAKYVAPVTNKTRLTNEHGTVLLTIRITVMDRNLQTTHQRTDTVPYPI